MIHSYCQTTSVNQQTTIPTIPVQSDGLPYQSMEIKTQIDQQFDQINQQFSELNLQYTQNYGLDQAATVHQPASLNDYNSQQQNYSLQSGPIDNNYNLYDQGQSGVEATGTGNSMMYGNEQQHLQQLQYDQLANDQVANDQSDYWNQQQSNEVI